MSLDAFLALTDDSLKTKFEAVEPDLAALRKPLLKILDTAAAQFSEGRTRAPNRIWRAKGDVVELALKLRGQPVLVQGKASLFIPSERFLDALKELRGAVEAGALDSALQAPQGKKAASAPAATGTRPAFSEERKVRSALSRYLGPLKMSLPDAVAAMKAKGKFSEALIDQVAAERT